MCCPSLQVFLFHFSLPIALTVFSPRPQEDYLSPITDNKQTCDVTTGYKKAERDREGGKRDWGEGWRTGCLCGDWKVHETGHSDNSHCCLRLHIRVLRKLCWNPFSQHEGAKSFQQKSCCSLVLSAHGAHPTGTCIFLYNIVIYCIYSMCIFFIWADCSSKLKSNLTQNWFQLFIVNIIVIYLV